MCLSSADRDRDFSMDSHDHILITPPSEPDQISPASKQHEEQSQNQPTKLYPYVKSFNLYECRGSHNRNKKSSIFKRKGFEKGNAYHKKLGPRQEQDPYVPAMKGLP